MSQRSKSHRCLSGTDCNKCDIRYVYLRLRLNTEDVAAMSRNAILIAGRRNVSDEDGVAKLPTR